MDFAKQCSLSPGLAEEKAPFSRQWAVLLENKIQGAGGLFGVPEFPHSKDAVLKERLYLNGLGVSLPLPVASELPHKLSLRFSYPDSMLFQGNFPAPPNVTAILLP